MNRTYKTLTLLALAALPFFAGCASPSEKIRRSIQADVPVNRQDVSAALAEGESPWALHDGEETFSLFEYASKKNNVALIEFCLSKKSLSPELAEAQCSAYVERVLASLSADKDSNDELSVCEKIWNAGLALAAKPRVDAKLKQVEEERATKFVESVIAKISVDDDADEDDLARCREYWDKGLALATKPRVDAKLKQVEEERATKFVESVIAKISVDCDADDDDLARCREYWDKGLALATKPRLETKQKQVAEERKAQREKASLEAQKKLELAEKQRIYESLQSKIFPLEQKLSEEERSRGWTLLETFGEEQMPELAEKCKAARQTYLEAKANLEELAKALKAENIDLNTNDVFQAVGRNWLSKATDYWFLRYKLTDFYSRFKIGAATSDELAAADEELAERL